MRSDIPYKNDPMWPKVCSRSGAALLPTAHHPLFSPDCSMTPMAPDTGSRLGTSTEARILSWHWGKWTVACRQRRWRCKL